MKYDSSTHRLTFSCIECEDIGICHSCRREKSAYEVGLYDGGNNMPYNNTFSSYNERECYNFGFKEANIV